MALFGKTDAAISRPKWLDVGQVKTINITNGGTGYSSATVSIAAPGGSGVTATATATVTNNIVTAITITNPGSGYTSAPVVTITGDGTSAAATAVIAATVYPASEIVFVDTTEVALDANKKKGITASGWWWVRQYTDQQGEPRYKTSCLVEITNTAGAAGDGSDDGTVADVNAVVTISVQPANQTTVSGGATFSVTASVAPSGSTTYQWQVRAPGASRFANINGATSASLVLTGKVVGDSGTSYRVIVGSDNGAPKVTSSSATLTFGS